MKAREETLAQRVSRLREGQGLTLSELARKSGISRSYLYQIESGESSPTADKLAALAAALDTPLPDLLGLPAQRPPIPDSLRTFAERNKLSTGEVDMLAGIQYRGRKPRNVGEWSLLYRAIKLALEDEA
jgi:transcriptional regulator with XRE-family HTH domain